MFKSKSSHFNRTGKHVMNIFFLSFNVDECAQLYCDQHVNKILLEIVQMLYTTWHKIGHEGALNAAPRKKNSTQRGYKSVSPNHPIVMWVRSHRNNYKFTARLGMALAIEFHHRFGKVHACTKHVMWLYNHIPTKFCEVRSEKAFYSTQEVPKYLTSIPECMPIEYQHLNILRANYTYYYMDKFTFARWTRDDSVPRFKERMACLP